LRPPSFASPPGTWAAEKEERPILLGVDQTIIPPPEEVESIDRADQEIASFPGCYPRIEPIPASEAHAIKDSLYSQYAPNRLRWQWRGGKYARASGIMLAILVAGIILLRTGRRRPSSPPL
jgi:hypothetical protein